MAELIYCKEFKVARSSLPAGAFDYKWERNDAVRHKALEKANEFFILHDSVDIVNVLEEWSDNGFLLHLIVYYKGYV